MVKRIDQKWFLIWCFIFAVILMNLPAVYTYFYHSITNAPEAMNGIIDLSTVNLADGIVYLDGQWEFYWKRLIVTEFESDSEDMFVSDSSLKSMTESTVETMTKSNHESIDLYGSGPASRPLLIPELTIKVPDSWSNYKIDGKGLPTGGFGSYKLTLANFKYKNAVTLCVQDFGGAYRIFVDGELAAESGKISKDTKKIFTTPKAKLYPVVLSEGMTHEVVLEVATSRYSGLYMTPVLCDYNQMINENSLRNAVRFILFGIALFSHIFLLILYVVTIRRKLNSLWLPVMILFIMIRIMLTSEFYSFWQSILFFNIPYESTNELMYLATFVLKYLVLFLVQEQCGINFSIREKVGLLIYYIVLYFIYLLTPQHVYNQYMSVLIPMLTYILDLYLFIRIYRERQTMNKYGMLIFWSAILVITGLTLDSYYINGKIYMNMSLSLMLMFTVFVLIISFVYAMRSAELYDDFTVSTSRLEIANNQIAMQKDYFNMLSTQMNEIREMKHDIRHFIGTVSRLAEEEKLDALKMLLNEYGEKADARRLPVFCENVIANSVIGYYYIKAVESGISFDSLCNIDKQSIISDSDLCIILGNALENAVYACQQMETKENRFISIAAGIMKKQILIKVTNSYNGNVSIQGGHLVSTKEGKSHGFGIRNIEKIVEAYDGIMKIEHDEKEFKLMVAIPEK